MTSAGTRRVLAWPVAPLALFAAVTLFVFWGALSGWIYYQDDTVIYYVPIGQRVHDALLHGRFPLWTPYIFGGHPLFADSEAGMLYPPNVLTWLVLPALPATQAQRALRFFLGAVFACALGRALGISRAGSTLVGLAFAFGSFLVGQLHHENLGDAAIWLPLILCLLERGFAARPAARWRWWVGAGAALGTQVLTIHVNPVLATLMVVAAYALCRCLLPALGAEEGAPVAARLRRALAALALVGGVGLGIGAVQLLPMAQEAILSVRAGGGTFGFATAFLFPPANLLTALFPYFFRDPASDAYWSPWFRWNTTLYAGVAPLALAAFALAAAVLGRAGRPLRGRIIFFAGAGLVALLLAVADWAPLDPYWLLWHLPLFSSTRVPSRYLLVVLLALAILAGFGLDLLARAMARRARSLVVVPTALGLGLLAVLWAGHAWVTTDPERARAFLNATYLAQHGLGLRHRNAPDPLAALAASLDPTSPWTGRTLAVMGAALALLILWRLLPRAGGALRLGLVLLTAADLALFARDFHPSAPLPAITGTGPMGRFLVAQRGVSAALDRIATLDSVWEVAPNRLMPYGLPDVNGYSSLQPERHREYMRLAERLNNRLLDIFGARYVVVARSRPPEQRPAGSPIFADDEGVLYERPTALPRAFLVGGAALAANADDALRELTAPGFDPRATLVVEDAAALAWIGPGEAPPVGDAEIVRYEPERVVLRVRATRRALLFLSDAYYPGWRARVDGADAPVYRADELFRAVPVEAGEHTVVMTFEPPAFRIGLALSAATLVVVLAALCAPWLRRLSWVVRTAPGPLARGSEP